MFSIIDIKLAKFMMVGTLNTLYSFLLMFVLHDIFRWGYWGSTATVYATSTCFSYLLNRNFTFKFGKSKFDWPTFGKFVAVAMAIYLISFSISKILIPRILLAMKFDSGANLFEWIVILCGMCLFTAINYLAQRFFVFKAK